MNKVTLYICTIIFSIGVLGAGYSVGKGVFLARMMSRTVSVKGLAEQDVKSDLGVWEINYREVGNDLVQIDQRLQHDQQAIIEFLKAQGFEENEIERTPLKMDDRFANIYSQPADQKANDYRYVVTAGLSVRTTKVDLIQSSLQATEKLLQQGILLSFDSASIMPNPSYYYTKLDSIRPAMLADATKSARAVAEQFAKDSGSRLAGIQRANQGQFQLMGRDSNSVSPEGSIYKKVRLVTTIDYSIR
jgi:hypothetical protein